MGWRTLSDHRKDAPLNLSGKAVCGKVAISVDKLKQPTKVTRFLTVPLLLLSLLVRTHINSHSFPVQFVNGTHSHPIRG